MIMDFAVLDTTTGGSSFCSPPAGWSGDATAYLDWLRERYKADRGFAQYLLVAGWKGPTAIKAKFLGPHADVLRQAIDRLWSKDPAA